MTAADADRLLVAEWRQLLARHATTWCALERALQEHHGLSASEFEVLERLAVGGRGQCRVQELADAAYLSQSAVSRLIARLERDGLVSRSMCELDRRGIYVCLTDAGRERHAAARPTQRAILAASLQATP